MIPGNKQYGVAAVEFAILVIPLLLIFVGITEFGRAMYYYNTIAKSVRDATRLMSTQTPTDPDYADLKDKATCTAVYGNQTCSGSPLLPGLNISMVSICDAASCPSTHASVPTGSGVINLVTVTVGGPGNPYTFDWLAPITPTFFGFPSFDFGAISVTMRQVL